MKTQEGVFLDANGQSAAAIDLLLSNLPQLEKQSEEGQLTFMCTLHEIYRRKNDLVNAAKWGYQSLRVAEKTGKKNFLTMAYGELSIDFLKLKDPQKALEFIEKGLALTQNDPELSLSRIDLSQRATEAYTLQKDWAKARHWAEESLRLARQVGAEFYEIQSLYFLARAEREMGLMDQAASNIRQASEKLGPDTLSRNARDIFNELGELALLDNHPSEAILWGQKALKTNSEIRRGDDFSLLHRAYKAAGDERQALFFYEKFIAARDSMNSVENQKAVIRQQIQADFDEKTTQSRYFQQRLLGSLVVLAVLFSSWFFWNRIRQRRQLRLASERAETERRLRVVSELEALRAQMNPHFVFNSLSTLENFILENRNQEAQGLLQKFSRLTRLVLENSARPLIPLEDDLTALKLYVELEQTRFQNAFDVEWELDAQVLEENPSIPPLIVQPFVENAILHGLRSKKSGDNSLKIKLLSKNEGLFFIIEDNGVGRKMATKLAQPKPPGQTSKGVQITERRIELFNQNSPRPATVAVSDLFPDREETGTRVELWLPA